MPDLSPQKRWEDRREFQEKYTLGGHHPDTTKESYSITLQQFYAAMVTHRFLRLKGLIGISVAHEVKTSIPRQLLPVALTPRMAIRLIECAGRTRNGVRDQAMNENNPNLHLQMPSMKGWLLVIPYNIIKRPPW
ncbi:hypothetical protein MGLY_19860 [Neomoorella glycerini]|uniref:Uncharacterized protein n=1 Tax=Neomoorella glycerini TaxID=55779 RepID=A0A6I5ZRX7_9FIRM|nr:hypothetical protein MGLY_19860 [Moorella glycerini]